MSLKAMIKEKMNCEISKYELGDDLDDLLLYPWPELRAEALYGVAGEFVRAVEPFSETDPAALLFQFLATFGFLVGRGPFIQVEADKHHCNEFVCIVGQSAKARKGSSWGYVDYLFSRVDPVFRRRTVSGLSSGEGLAFAVRDPVKNKKGEIIDEGAEDKRLLVYEPEFVRCIKVMKREGNILSPVLRQAWDHGNLSVLTKNDPIVATNSHVTIIAHITQHELIRSIDKIELSNGFCNRFIWVASRRSKILPFGGPKNNLEHIVEEVRYALAFAREVGELDFAPSAKELWVEIYKEFADQPTASDSIEAILSRGEPHVLRLSLLYSLLDKSPRIERKHLEAAWAAWQYGDASVRYLFGDCCNNTKTARKIVNFLREAGGKLTSSELYGRFSRHLKKEKLNAAIRELESAGLVKVERIMTTGRPKIILCLEKKA